MMKKKSTLILKYLLSEVDFARKLDFVIDFVKVNCEKIGCAFFKTNKKT
jgi:hypothetical protein